MPAANTQTDSFDVESSRRDALLGAALILALTLVAYAPAMLRGGFIWDDDAYVTNNALLQQGVDGLMRLWIPRETPQYYPVVFTTFWIEYQLWGLDPTGYHVVNVLLHALNAILVWLLARRLKIPWPWLIGAIFALHPVHVESVAWITERKNTLSGCFYLLAALAYLRFDEHRARSERGNGTGSGGTRDSRWAWYAVALLCFVLALLSKSVTCSLPAALILMMLWQRKRLTIARLAPLLPLFAIGLALALNTAHIEREHVGATGDSFDFSIADRALIASKALLFYPSKIVWPWPLMFVYPRWVIDESHFAQYWSVAVVLGVAIGVAILYFRGTRGPALALAFFAGTIFPALGFVNVYPMIFSFVADHFQYLASLGVIALVVGGLAAMFKTQRAMIVVAAIVLPSLGALTWKQAGTYENEATVWRDTLSKNEAAFMPHNNLATYLLRRMEDAHEAGDPIQAAELEAEAEQHLRRALELRPEYGQALTNMADLLRTQGKYEEGLQYAQRALATILSKREVRETLAAGDHPVSAPIAIAHFAVGRLQELLGRNDEALASYRESVAWTPRDLEVQGELARLLMKLGREDEAVPPYEAVLKLDPNSIVALSNLATIRQKHNRHAEARDLLSRALDAATGTPDALPMYLRLVRLLATSPDPQVRDTKQAVAMMESLVQQSQRRDPSLLDVLASVLAEDKRLPEAIRTAQEAASLADRMQLTDMAKEFRARQRQYEMRMQPPTPLIGPATRPTSR